MTLNELVKLTTLWTTEPWFQAKSTDIFLISRENRYSLDVPQGVSNEYPQHISWRNKKKLFPDTASYLDYADTRIYFRE